MIADPYSRRLLAVAGLLAAFCAAAPHFASAQQQQAPTLVVHNAGQALINTLQISPSSTDRWGPDLLGALQVMPNSAVRVSFAPNTECQQDLRVTFTDNAEETRMRVDVCTAGEVAFGAAPPR
jgi:hypothetical protein